MVAVVIILNVIIIIIIIKIIAAKVWEGALQCYRKSPWGLAGPKDDDEFDDEHYEQDVENDGNQAWKWNRNKDGMVDTKWDI